MTSFLVLFPDSSVLIIKGNLTAKLPFFSVLAPSFMALEPAD